MEMDIMDEGVVAGWTRGRAVSSAGVVFDIIEAEVMMALLLFFAS